MELLNNWWEILTRAWSLRFMALAAAMELAGNIVPYLDDFFPHWLTILIIGAAFVSRFVSQGISEDKKDSEVMAAADAEEATDADPA